MIEPRLEATRRRLLDLSRRNRLLNHKPGASTNLRVVDEVAEEVYRLLVVDAARLQFLSREEAPAGAVLDEPATPEATAAPPPVELPTSGAPAPGAALALAPLERHADRRLQTALEGEALQTRLLQIAREAASAVEEQGANVLYLALGVVEWRETPEGVSSRAPLVFVPAELARKSVNSRFSLARFDDDVVTNPCLVELASRQFRFELPVFDPEGDLGDYFRSVEEAIRALPGWRFAREIHLGLFSFAKLLMYRDLDPATWPAEAPLVAHPLVRAFSGDAVEELEGEGVPDPSTLDDEVAPDECYQVLDADSSQQAAILAAKRGASAVVEGPPGTGKSQTIANIVAECMSEGKTVLFVAEKSAALEVVKRRLETVGLGDFVLELHSRKASKRAVLEEINRSLVADADARRAAAVDARELATTRARLNDYVRALHTPVAPLGLSPFDAISRLAALEREPEVSCELSDVGEWSAEQLAHARHLVETLDRRLSRIGELGSHAWRGAGLVAVGLQVRQKIGERGEALVGATRELRDAGRALAGLVGAVEPHATGEASRLAASAGFLLAAPELPEPLLGDERWDAAEGVDAWLGKGAERERRRAAWRGVFAPEAETRDWRETLERRRRQHASFLRFFTPSWYRDNRELKSVRIAAPSGAEEVAALDALVASGALRNEIEAEADRWAPLFGPLWRGVDGDWAALERAANAIRDLRRRARAGELSLEAARAIVSSERRGALEAATRRVETAVAAARRASVEWLQAIASTEEAWYRTSFEATKLDDAESRVLRAFDAAEGLQDWADLNAALAATRSAPVEPFVRWALSPSGRFARGRLANAFERHFLRLWTDGALERSEPLRRFRGEDHEALVERFRALDREWLEASRRRLADLVRASRPDMTRAASRASKLGIVQAEIRKQRNIMPLRRLFAVAGDVVQAIKPCFMMSPISVAQYLAPGAIDFDLVVFDEASQVEPADAYGAIARGRQLLLVGDERQLPPTSFFAKIESDEPGPDGAGDGEVAATDLESILAVGAVRLPNRCRLRWHYRSRHASLIEFSNERFYGDAPLRVFPSPHTSRDELGLAFRHVPGGVYMRGAGQHNPVEAAEVAAAVVAHAVEHPGLSLGVGAFSISQQRAIQDEIERLRRESGDERVERFFESHAEEPFFVKNLETIQGDERDVVFLSVGYGRDAAGRLTMNFGPLNREGGWRRLNVLVTRARRRCVLFASFRSDEMNLGETTARGVGALKDYLYYAEHGRMPTTGAPGRDHDSPFEAEVCRALRERGWEVHAQVGAAGFAIDLAVVDPERPGRYLLGVECDGATYHASATARDRDRLRQAVLEGLGWRIHRVWSTDWFRRPQQTLAALLARVERAREEARLAEERVEATEANEPADAGGAVEANESAEAGGAQEAGERGGQPPLPLFGAAAAELPPGVVAYRRDATLFGPPEAIARMSAREAAGVVAAIVREEAPIHVEEAVRALAAKFGTRASKRVQTAFERGLAEATAAGAVSRRGDFLWEARDRTRDAPDGVRVRHRGGDCPVTRPELIAPEEYEAAVRLALSREFGVTRDGLVASVARLLGYARRGSSLSREIETAIDALVAAGAVAADAHGFLVLAD